MAHKIQTLLIDDVDGGPAVETVTFGLDGVQYEIDLSAEHSGDLRDSLGIYVEHARKVRPAVQRGGRVTGRAATPKLDTNAIRDWARENGYDIKDRGRIPGEMVAKYQAATGR